MKDKAREIGIEKVLIIGSGLMGTSVALALKHHDIQVFLQDITESAVETAVSRGAGEAFNPAIHGEPDLVVVAVPPQEVAGALEDALRDFPHATVTDVASVKVGPSEAVEALGDEAAAARYVGSHPMAGREFSGAFAAKHDLFIDRTWVIMESPQASEEAKSQVKWLVSACGAIPLRSTPQAHDRAVALTSHTPQLLSTIMAAELLSVQGDELAISGQGLRDVTRLAASDADLWTGIVAGNATEIRPILESISDQVLGLIAALGDPDTNSQTSDGPIHELIQQGNSGRASLPDKHGGSAPEYALVTVVVDDRPGELGRLFAVAGEAGVNLEDVRIEHTLGRLTATVELAVNAASVGHFEQVLADGGWRVQRVVTDTDEASILPASTLESQPASEE